jgi:type II secretory pathway pseudopilin PulG
MERGRTFEEGCAVTWIMNRLQRRLADEAGFSLVEGIVGISILAVGLLAVAQAMTFSLHSSGLARQRLGARAAIEQQMELTRALNYTTLVLSDTDPIPYETDPDNPDHWVNETDQTYDPDGNAVDLGYEEIVREPGANPAIQHYQAPVVSGNVTFAVYMYVTWADAASDGLGTADIDADTHDAKRVTVVVTWTDPTSGELESSRVSSLFSVGTVPFQDSSTLYNQSPVVSCPTATYTDLDYRFTANATDPDGTIVSYTWRAWGTGAVNYFDQTYTGEVIDVFFPEDGTYRVRTTAYDDDGAFMNNFDLQCQVTASLTSNNAGGNDATPTTGTVVAASGAAYTKTQQVTLTLTYTETCLKMQFSSDGVTWTDKVDCGSTALFTLTDADGLQTVYARFWRTGSKYGPWTTDTITLDRVAPNPATGSLTWSKVNSGGFKNVTFSWGAPSPSSADQSGYRIYYRATTANAGTPYTQGSCTPITTTSCLMSSQLGKNTSYQVYLVYYDHAGNESAQLSTTVS